MSLITLTVNAGYQLISATNVTVQNQGSCPIQVKESATLPDSSTRGFILQPYQIEQFDLAAGNSLYARTTFDAGYVLVEEIA